MDLIGKFYKYARLIKILIIFILAQNKPSTAIKAFIARSLGVPLFVTPGFPLGSR